MRLTKQPLQPQRARKRTNLAKEAGLMYQAMPEGTICRHVAILSMKNKVKPIAFKLNKWYIKYHHF